MLVLTRNTDESILIGGRITVTVLEVRGDKVRLGIDAPIEIPILRNELIPLEEKAA
jgi:carbon storage regulator